jgi:hypothetical protein
VVLRLHRSVSVSVCPVVLSCYVETNWDPWVPETASDCQAEMASFTPEREKQCESYLKGLYNDQGPCTDLCQLYSDGRRYVWHMNH